MTRDDSLMVEISATLYCTEIMVALPILGCNVNADYSRGRFYK
jgi:hypothetical protein